MKYIVSTHAQGTDEWLADRAGRLNGSEVSGIYAAIKTGEAAARRDLRMKIVGERLTATAAERGFVSPEMTWGTETEPAARRALESFTGHLVEEVGYCYRPDLMVGCSPDGLVEDEGKRGGIELKCPKMATHLGYLKGSELPSTYVAQVRHLMWVCDLDFVIFGSFDPRWPAPMQLFTVRVERKDMDIDGHERAVLQFLKETDAEEREIRARFL